MEQHKKIVLLEHLMTEYGNYLKRTAYLYLGDVQVAEDMAQETFIKFFDTMDQFRQESSYKTYLYRILMNQCKMYLRKNKHELKVRRYESIQLIENDMKDNRDEYSAGFENQVIQKQLITDKILRLDRKSREVIILYYYNEWTIHEISDIINVSRSSVKMRLKRARDKLAMDLGKEGFHEQ